MVHYQPLDRLQKLFFFKKCTFDFIAFSIGFKKVLFFY